MQDPFENTQRLLRLKRYERPGDDYFERFLDQFNQRQRAEMLRNSSRRVLLDRLSTVWWESGLRRWVPAAAGAACLAVVTWIVVPGSGIWQVGEPGSEGADSMQAAETEAGKPAGTEPLGDGPDSIRFTGFSAAADPIEFTADGTLDSDDVEAAGVTVIPPGVDSHARPLFEPSRLRMVSGTGEGNYIPLSDQ